MLVKLSQHRVSKPWGRTDVPESFSQHRDDEPLGEIWFQRPDGTSDALLVKYLFTSERLSIQVHPDDQAARKAGMLRGKDEAWLVLAAEPEAEIGIGLNRAMSLDALQQAALDGTIVDAVDWRRVAKGDAFYSPAGTIHAIGAGLTLLEVQQNADVTYRLYDYGRRRELHLEEGIRASKTGLEIPKAVERKIDEVRSVIVDGPKFTVERLTAGERSLPADEVAPLWLIPVRGSVLADGELLRQPGVWIVDSPVSLTIGDDSELLVAYEGQIIRHAAPAD